MTASSTQDAPRIIRGEFVTDGATYVFTLSGAPISGIGATPDAAFADLMRAESSAGGLAQRIEELARDQQGEAVRAALVRWTMIAFIMLGALGGAVVGAVALTGRVISDFSTSSGLTPSGGEPKLASAYDGPPRARQETGAGVGS